MNEHTEKQNSKTALEEYVTAAIAEDTDLADEYRDILLKHDIPAVTATQRSYSSSILGIAVMVPANYLAQAQEIIESQQAFDTFLDFAFNDDDKKETNSDDFDIDDEF